MSKTMPSMVNLELEEKINNWAMKNPKFKRFIDNKPLIKQMYLKHNMAETVSDILEGGKAKLTLMVITINNARGVMLCKECNRKACDTNSCGAEDYVEKKSRSYNAVDVNYKGNDDKAALIRIAYAPFDNEMADLEENEMYEIEGTIDAWKGKFSIRPQKVTKQDADTPIKEAKAATFKEAVECAENLLEMGDGKVPIKKWDSLMKEYEPYLERVFVKLFLEEKEGAIISVR